VSKANSLKFELTGITSSMPNHDTPPNILLLLFGVSTSSGELQPVLASSRQQAAGSKK